MYKRLVALAAGIFLSFGISLAQTDVTGTVTSAEDGEPIVGAVISVDGTSTGTTTDVDGKFSLNVPAGTKLKVEYIGMKTQFVTAQSNLNIVLQDDTHQMAEVVVTGYGVVKKQAFTGSAETVDSKDISNKVDPNPIKSLQGTVPGLQMNIGSGQPGAPASIYIRGRNSINSGTQPLYVIDGVAFNNDEIGIRSDEGQSTSPLSTINAQDIESITVLKDATATAIYGSRAANGVIVITTKHGQSGKPKVNATMKLGWNEMPSYTNRYKIVGADKSIELAKEALTNDYNDNGENSVMGLEGYTPDQFDDFFDSYVGSDWLAKYRETGKQTDWMKAITRKGLVQSYSVDVTGGGNGDYAPVYYASLAYDDDKSMMKGKDLKRYSFRLNLDHQVSKVFKYGVNSNFSYTKTDMGTGGGYYSDPMTQVYMMSPLTSVYNEDGSWNFDTSTGYNPVAMRSKGGDKNVAKQYRVLLSPYLQINFTPNLFFLSRNSVDAYIIDEFGYSSFLDLEGAEDNGDGENANSNRTLLTTTNTLNYIKSFGNNNLNLMLGQEGQRSYEKRAYLAGDNYPVEDMRDVYVAARPTQVYTTQDILKLSSFFFNGQYDYNNRYYASFSLRTDGSSRFADGHRWGTFWSVGGKYRLSEEKFMQPASKWLSNLDLRASYGTTGNQEVGNGYYAYKGLYSFGYNYNDVGGMYKTQVANPDLTWEKTKKFNVGLDLTLFDRISLTMDYYNHQTSDMVFAVPLSLTTGNSVEYENVGKLENKGFEFEINANLIKTNNLTWDISLNGSTNKNVIKKLYTDSPIEGDTQITEVGRPIFQWKMKEYAGVDPQTGDALWYLNETGDETTTDYNKAAKRYLGDANPSFLGSFSTSLNAYGFDFNVQFNYATGFKIYGDNLRYDEQLGYSFSEAFTNYIYDHRWTTPGQITNVPKVTAETTSANEDSSRFLMNGNYLKLQSLTLGYTLPKNIVSKIGLSNLRLFIEADNLYTWTASNYRGMDPAGVDANGYQDWNYPEARSFLFGLTVGL